MAGKWVGFDKELNVDSGPWALVLMDVAADDATLERYNRSPQASETD